MKATPTRYATCEKDFVVRSIQNGIRLDGRHAYDYRSLNIQFGEDYGCCEVQLGDTRVLAQTSCELVKPVDSRPTEGQLFLNVDLSPMASPSFEAGRMTNQGLEINRLVERCLKESRPIDVESLCLVAGEKVWSIRVDIVVLNDCGNILDCSCIAAIASLAHFKRQDVTVTGSEVVIHSFKEKAPVSLNVHHMPICTTFGFIEGGEQMIVDPEEKEESVMSGKMVMAFNIYGEVCCAQMSGGVSLDYEQIMQCASIASVKASEITELIKAGLEDDVLKRTPEVKKRRSGLKDPPDLITRTVAEPSDINTDTLTDIQPISHLNPVEIGTLEHLVRKGNQTASIGRGGSSTWVLSDGSDDNDTFLTKQINDHKQDINAGDDSEEDMVMVLHSDQLDGEITESDQLGILPSDNTVNTVLNNRLHDDDDSSATANDINSDQIKNISENNTPKRRRRKKKKKIT